MSTETTPTSGEPAAPAAGTTGTTSAPGDTTAPAEEIEPGAGEGESQVEPDGGDGNEQAEPAEGDAGDGEDGESQPAALAPYTPPDGSEVTPAGLERIAQLDAWAVEHGIDAKQRDGLIGLYDTMVQAQQAQIDEGDKVHAKEANAALTKLWGGPEARKANLRAITELLDDATCVPQDLAAAISTARSPDGRRLINNPAFADMLLRVARGQGGKAGDTGMSEEAELNDLLHKDVGSFQNARWRGTDQTPSQRLMEIERAKVAKVATNDTPTREEVDLEKLMKSDISKFQNEIWRSTGKTGSARLLELERARQGARR